MSQSAESRVFRILCPNCQVYNTLSFKSLKKSSENQYQVFCKYCQQSLQLIPPVTQHVSNNQS